MHTYQVRAFPLPINIKDYQKQFVVTWQGEGQSNSSPLSHNRVWRTSTLLTPQRASIVLTEPEEQIRTSITEAKIKQMCARMWDMNTMKIQASV